MAKGHDRGSQFALEGLREEVPRLPCDRYRYADGCEESARNHKALEALEGEKYMQQNYHPQQNYPQQPPPNNNALIGLVWIGAAIAMGIMLFILGFLSIGLAWCLLPFMEKYLTVEEVSQELRVSIDTVHRILNHKNPKKRLIGSKIGGTWRISREDLDRYVEAQKNTDKSE